MELTVAQIHTIVSVSAVTFLTLVCASYFYQKKKRNHPPKEWTAAAKVTDLFIYPLKSGRRLEISAGECSPVGLMTEHDQNVFQLRDRSFVVYGENNNEFKTARQYPKLLLIEPSVHDKGHIVFDSSNERPLYVRIPQGGADKSIVITLHSYEKISTLDCGDEAASWFSRFLLDKPSGLRLGYHDGSFIRDIGQVYKEKYFKTFTKLNNDAGGMYSDLTSYSLINRASIDEIKSKSPEPLNVNYYRPNIYVEGDNLTAFAEEDWDWIKIGDTVFRNVKPCVRCILTTINPETAVRSAQREPLKTLEKLNTLKDPVHVAKEGKGPVMGIHLALIAEGRIKTGDVVYVGKNEN